MKYWVDVALVAAASTVMTPVAASYQTESGLDEARLFVAIDELSRLSARSRTAFRYRDVSWDSEETRDNRSRPGPRRRASRHL